MARALPADTGSIVAAPFLLHSWTRRGPVGGQRGSSPSWPSPRGGRPTPRGGHTSSMQASARPGTPPSAKAVRLLLACFRRWRAFSVQRRPATPCCPSVPLAADCSTSCAEGCRCAAVSATPPAAASGMNAEALVALCTLPGGGRGARVATADGTESWFLLRYLPWMLPALASPATMATSPAPTDSFGSRDSMRCCWSLVNTPRSVVLQRGPALLTRCSVAPTRPARARTARPSAAARRRPAVRAWRTTSGQLPPNSEGDGAAHASAMRGSTASLHVLGSIGRAAACRGGQWTSSVPRAFVGLLTTPPPHLATQSLSALHAWLRAAADGIKLLTQPTAPDLLRERGAQLAPLLAQRLHSALSPPLRSALDQLSADLQQQQHHHQQQGGGGADRPSTLSQGTHWRRSPPASPAHRRRRSSRARQRGPHLLQWLASLQRMPGGRLGARRRRAALRRLRLARLLIRALPESDAELPRDVIPTLLALPQPARPMTCCCLATRASIPSRPARPPRRLAISSPSPPTTSEVRALRALDTKRRVRAAACRCATAGTWWPRPGCEARLHDVRARP